MLRWKFILMILVTLFTSFATAETPGEQAARRVVQRTIGERVRDFTFHLVSTRDGKDFFEVVASKGKVTITASSPVALTRGAYHFLRTACNSQATWSGKHITLPQPLPDVPYTRVETPYRLRQYFNVCTFGYTTAFWDWTRWEREIDWMALHGINMPLAMAGQEIVWQRVWRDMGINDRELEQFFSGPAFLPWHRMGNINSHGGPLPQGWIDAQAQLQKKILDRMRELGMTPVVPAFSGFVPKGFQRLHPDATVYPIAPWSGFPAECQTFILSPRSPIFIDIGKAFIKEYAKEFGAGHYYLADSFNELQVPVTQEHRYDELAAFGKAVYESIAQGDPQGVWVMQGWLFYFDAKFWDKPSVKALLSQVPNDRMILLDLANEMFQGWKAQDAFHGKQWIYSTINNFGGNNPLNGNVPFLARDAAETVASPARGNLVGFGMAPEGIENNELIYELLTDISWAPGQTDLEQWWQRYASSRYGACPPAMTKAGSLLLRSTYAHGNMNIRHAFMSRPELMPTSWVDNSPEFMQAVDAFLSCARELGGSQLYVNDAVELVAQKTGIVIDDRLREAGRAHKDKLYSLRDTLYVEAVGLMRDMDALIAARPDMRLERWIGDARHWAVKPEEADFYEENARRQVTIWGGPILHEYAAKVWSGLLRDFYAPRWKYFIDLIQKHPDVQVPDSMFLAWEERWVKRTTLSPEHPVKDGLAGSLTLLDKLGHLTSVTPEPRIEPRLGYYPKGTIDSIRILVPAPYEIRYTLDGSDPVASSLLYKEPIPLTKPVTVRARSFNAGSIPGFIAEKSYSEIVPGLNGLTYRYSEGEWNTLPDFDSLKILRTGTSYNFDLDAIKQRGEYWALTFAGFLQVAREGEYTFSTISDDGSKLFIDGREVVNNDGVHGAQERRGTIHLSSGYHAIDIRYFQGRLGASLKILYAGPEIPLGEIPASRLFLSKPGK